MPILDVHAKRAMPGRQDKSSSGDLERDGKAEFRLSMRADGRTDDGALFSENTYIASDGEKVRLEIVHYKSEEQVKEAFERHIKLADKVSERGPIRDKDGQVVAERAVLLMHFPWAGQKPVSLIILTDGVLLLVVWSYSLLDALELEKYSAQPNDEGK
jgi:hypothetical protein